MRDLKPAKGGGYAPFSRRGFRATAFKLPPELSAKRMSDARRRPVVTRVSPPRWQTAVKVGRTRRAHAIPALATSKERALNMVDQDSSAAPGATGKRDGSDAAGLAFEHAVRIREVADGIRVIHDIGERQKIGGLLNRSDVLPERELRALRKLAAAQAIFILGLAEQITEALFDFEADPLGGA